MEFGSHISPGLGSLGWMEFLIFSFCSVGCDGWVDGWVGWVGGWCVIRDRCGWVGAWVGVGWVLGDQFTSLSNSTRSLITLFV